MTTFTRHIAVEPAWDKRSTDPKTNYGISAVTMRFHIEGPLGAVSFSMCTGMHLPAVDKELREKTTAGWNPFAPMGMDVSYHAHTRAKDYENKQESCNFIEGTCYSDGSGLMADEVLQLMLAGGEDAVWKKLEELYTDWLEKRDG